MKLVVRWKYFYPLMRFLGALGITLIVTRLPMNSIEGYLYDLRVRLSPTPATSGKIATIVIDAKTVSQLQGHPDTQDSMKLVTELQKENPEAIMYLADPSKWTGTLEQKTNFAQEASRIFNFFFVTEQLAPLSQNTRLRLAKPLDNLSLASGPVTRDNVTFAGDRVTRRTLISFDGQLLIQAVLANLTNRIIDAKKYRGSFDQDDAVYNYIRFHHKGFYPKLSFVDVIHGNYPQGFFKNKIVVVGRDTELDNEDYVTTPYSRHLLAMSKVEAQANVLDTLIQNNGVVRAPPWLDLLVTLLLAYITVLIVWSARPLSGILALIGIGFALSVLSYFVFAIGGLWINLVHPLVAIFISYYFFIPYRLIVENKKSWEYLQKNMLLTQVEELKSNFLSMMSHDLKTPIARIQGMAEIALAEKEKLTAPQKDALNSILLSSDELGTFISSILDLSRIESKEVKLQKTSRDINAVLKDVIKKYEFNARAKNITVQTQLDPLFSVKVDVDLIRQVFSNLIENAIKYSPDGSQVLVTSKEEEGRIKVTVQDTGNGIPQDEIDKIFSKFYRGKAAKASPAKGSGLGLYLAKYFIDLHNGEIGLVSEPGKGSTFTVQLPLDG